MNWTAFFDWKIGLVLALTLGLAPFSPEPHLFGKVRWVLGGAEGMAPSDWLDLLMHGAPWCYLLISLVLVFFDRSSDKS